jgi:hypothetical protein
MKWEGHVVCMKIWHACEVFVGKLGGKRPFERPRSRWKDNIRRLEMHTLCSSLIFNWRFTPQHVGLFVLISFTATVMQHCFPTVTFVRSWTNVAIQGVESQGCPGLIVKARRLEMDSEAKPLEQLSLGGQASMKQASWGRAWALQGYSPWRSPSGRSRCSRVLSDLTWDGTGPGSSIPAKARAGGQSYGQETRTTECRNAINNNKSNSDVFVRCSRCRKFLFSWHLRRIPSLIL